MSSALVRALLDELDDEALDLLAERLRPRLEAQTRVQTAANGRSPWLNVNQAAEFLACPKSRVYDLVSLAKLPAAPRRHPASVQAVRPRCLPREELLSVAGRCLHPVSTPRRSPVFMRVSIAVTDCASARRRAQATFTRVRQRPAPRSTQLQRSRSRSCGPATASADEELGSAPRAALQLAHRISRERFRAGRDAPRRFWRCTGSTPSGGAGRVI